jgi:hypothetical protein
MGVNGLRRNPANSVLAGTVGLASLASARPGEEEGARSAPAARGCATFDAAADAVAVQDLFDPESGQLTLETPDAVYLLSERDDACIANPITQRRLLQAREMADESFKAMCEDFRKAVAEGTTELKGRRVNLDAARRALEGRCVQWLK